MKKYLVISLCILLIISIVMSYFYIQCIPRLKTYGQFEISRLNQLIVSHSSIDSDYQDLLIIERNTDNEIDLLEFDMVKVNQLASQIVMDLENTYTSIETGTYQAKDDSYYEKRIETISQSGIISRIPISTLLNIPFMSPALSIHYKHLSTISSSINKSIENYGLNHIMVELSIEINMKLTMIYPFFEQYDTYTITVPILLEIFPGQVPLIYYR